MDTSPAKKKYSTVDFRDLNAQEESSDMKKSIPTNFQLKEVKPIQLQKIPFSEEIESSMNGNNFDTYLFKFPISCNLLNLLRQPTANYDKHAFDEEYLIKIKKILDHYKKLPLYQELEAKRKTNEISGIHYILYVHFALAYTTNLQNLVSLCNSHYKIRQIKSFINSTNIMNTWSIIDSIDFSVTQQSQKQIDLNLLDNQFQVLISEDKQISTWISGKYKLILSQNVIFECLLSFGQFDLHFASYVIRLLPTNQFPIILAYTKNPKEYINGYSTILKQILKEKEQIASINFEQWSNRQIKQIIEGKGELHQIRSMILSAAKDPNLQRLLIGMLGWGGQTTEEAVRLLNLYYDQTDWQMLAPFRPTISWAGRKFKINYLVQNVLQHEQELVFLIKAPCLNIKCKRIIESWHKPKLLQYINQQTSYLWVQLELGRFTKAGYYDWKLVKVNPHGKTSSVNKIINLEDCKTVVNIPEQQMKIKNAKPVQGRYIIQPAISKDLQIHEVVVDMQGQTNNQNNGNFEKVEKELENYKNFGINCIYLMGILERDNGAIIANGKPISYKRPNASPLAAVCRRSINTMLGGEEKLKKLCKKANMLNLKLIVDCVARVSSSRMHKRYRQLINYGLDQNGKKKIIYGTDGRALNFEDTAILNYRKKEVWDLMIQEIIILIEKLNIGGIHLDNGQAWPQIFKLDNDQLYRKQSDNQNAYTYKEIFEGAVVLKDQNCGYWGSEAKQLFPNPFLVKLCKEIWKRYPQFLIISETWGNLIGTQQRSIHVIKSGPIPRMFKLPIGISYIFGQQLHKDGNITKIQPKNVSSLKKWYEQTQNLYPKGSIIIQSTTSYSWPYPAFLYKRATWAVVDLFFFLPDIPMTFIGEQQGEVYRTKSSLIFTSSTKTDSFSSKGFHRIDSESQGLKKIDSKFFAQQQYSDYQKGGFPSFVYSSIRDSTEIPKLQQSFIKEVGPQYGYNLKQIYKHYQHRRMLRNKFEVLRKGKLKSVQVEHQYGFHTHVIAFVRWTRKQLALVAINFNEGPVDMFFNLRSLKYVFPNYEHSNIVVELRDLLNTNQDQSQNFYVINQFITSKIDAHLEGYKSLLWEIIIHTGGQKLEWAEKCSNKRLMKRILQTPPKWIYSSNLTNNLICLLQNNKGIVSFMEGFVYLFETIIFPNKIDLNLIISKTHDFWINRNKIYKLFGYFKKLSKDYRHALPPSIVQALEKLLNQNKLGPIAFITPQIGQWSTVGGLGVMVDELSKQLAKIGEQVVVLSPYYQYNKKGQTGYLLKDGFKYERNIEVWSSNIKYQFGLHSGKLNGIQYLWLHNSQLFSAPYKGEQALYVIKQLVFFALATLQSFCQMKIFPSTIVTNDWFSGLVSAYVKNNRYKDVFDGTKFMHIVHNLDPLYEGRLYPKYESGDLGWLTQLPSSWIIDPNSQRIVINPSRCALTTCDNWGTVSHSYKFDLLKDSPLGSVLWKHPNPFSFPNGVRKQERLLILQTKTPGSHLQSKRLIQRKYFKCADLQNNIPLLSFVGRVTKQKGVHLILDVIQKLLYEYNFKIQFLIGGPSDSRQQYGKFCAERMIYLANKYPKCVWANPMAFFEDGALINIGSNFGLMPSLFEPGGIVQHEFFAGSTPVISFRTGGLKDTVFEFDAKTGKGNGFNFLNYESEDFKNCIQRALTCFKNTKNYEILRKNAFDSVIDVQDVAKAWNNQFHRLHNKIFVQWNMVDNEMKNLESAQVKKIEPKATLFEKQKGTVWTSQNQITKNFQKILIGAQRLKAKQHQFTFHTQILPRPKQICIAGSWDDWKERKQLKFDNFSKIWKITLLLQPGTYLYKYVMQQEWVCSSQEPIDIDIKGATNNIATVQ